MALTVALVHPVEIGREERRLVPAGAGAEFDDGVAVVEGVAREEELVQLLGEREDFGGQPGHVGPGHAGELGIGLASELLGLGSLIFGPGQALRQPNDRREPGVLPAQRLQLRGILGRGGIGEEPFHLLRPLHRLAESGLH